MPDFVPSAAASTQPTSSCNSYLLCDLDTGDIIFANKPDERIYPASVTKMMTALILLEKKSDLGEKVTVGSEINSLGPDASRMNLVQGEVISYKDLLYGMMLVSGNDAACTVAVHIGGSISGFADLMNQEAAELGMTNSHFVNPHGMHSTDHYTTSADLAKLAIACMKNTTFAQVVQTPSYTTAATNKCANGHPLETTNRLLSTKSENATYHYPAAIGIKTGSTSAAQGCLVAAARKDGRTLIAVLMGDNSTVNGLQYAKRWTDAVNFFDYGFGLTRVDLIPLITKLSNIGTLPAHSNATLYAALPASLSLWTDAQTAQAVSQSGAITVDVQYNSAFSVVSPTSQPIGTAIFRYGDRELYRTGLTLVPANKAAAVASATSISPNRGWKILLWSMALLICIASLLFIVALRHAVKLRRRQAAKARALENRQRAEMQRRMRDRFHEDNDLRGQDRIRYLEEARARHPAGSRGVPRNNRSG